MTELPPREARSFRRRSRRYQGATWTPKDQSAQVGDGVWCKQCKKRHGYKESLGILYYHNNQTNKWEVHWTCPVYGTTLEIRA